MLHEVAHLLCVTLVAKSGVEFSRQLIHIVADVVNLSMDCVGGAMAGDSSGRDSTSVSSADSAAEISGSLSARTLGRRPMTRANTSRRAKRRLWIFTFV